MFGPGELDQQGHGNRRENRVTGVVSQTNGQETEHQRLGFFPIPKILVQDVNHDDQEGEEDGFEGFQLGLVSEFAY